MGLDYEFRLQFPRSQLPNVLNAVARLSPRQDREGTDVVFPDRTVHLPYTSDFKSGAIVYDDAMKYLRFDTTLHFQMDGIIERWIATDREEGMPVDDSGYATLGYVYLTVCLHPDGLSDPVSFDFQPATSCMSLLFAASDSIRRTFVQLLKTHNGIRGEFHDSDGNWGPVVIWPEHDPNYDATNLLVLHDRLSPAIPYYRKNYRWLSNVPRQA